MVNFEQETVILPIQQKDIFKNSSLLSAPKGRGYFEYLKMFTQINAPSHLNASLHKAAIYLYNQPTLFV